MHKNQSNVGNSNNTFTYAAHAHQQKLHSYSQMTTCDYIKPVNTFIQRETDTVHTSTQLATVITTESLHLHNTHSHTQAREMLSFILCKEASITKHE